MLVLTRMKNESIIIDGCIKVQILEIKGNKVKVGINAPKEIAVHRQEIQEQIDKEAGIETVY